ncbi:protein of unknown function [Candidatus Filomicrobium marinum]|uniref:Uncharacterized protein n=1 Tax=Candidatus Filomicrobium marinum TaxID=1608628 RepID=A0A0D6JED8_9HYPH|nr:protein of unknown function [Candidatus Filomicrobium marinum]
MDIALAHHKIAAVSVLSGRNERASARIAISTNAARAIAPKGGHDGPHGGPAKAVRESS